MKWALAVGYIVSAIGGS